MPNETTLNTPRWPRRAQAIAGAYALVGGVSSFCGWLFDVRRLTDWYNNGISIQPNATLCVALSGLALLMLYAQRRRAAAVCGGLVALIGGATLLEWITGVSFGIDSLLLFRREWGRVGVIVPGRMGPPGSLSWTLIGTALLLASLAKRPAWRRWVSVLALLSLMLGLISTVSYLYGASILHTMPRLTVIALQTATFIIALSIGLLASVPDRQPLRGLLVDNAAGMLARRMLPVLIGLPIVLGWLRVTAQNAGMFDSAFGSTLRTIVEIILLSVLLWQAIALVSRHEEALRAQQEELTDAQRIAHVGSWHWDAATDVTSGSDELYRIYGLDPAAGPFPDFKDQDDALYPHQSWQRINDATRQALRTGVGYELSVTALRNGQTIWITTRSEAVRDASGRIIGLRGTVQDVTATKEQEDALARAYETAEAANIAKDNFLATLSHGLRTPLTPVLATLSSWEALRNFPEELREDLLLVRRNVDLEARLIDDLLDLTRIVKGKIVLHLEVLDVQKLLDSLVGMYRSEINAKRIGLSMTAEATRCFVRGDPGRLQQAIWNLLKNAVKFTPAGGRIDITTRNDADGHVQVLIHDTGIGISADALKRLFQPFEQGDSELVKRYGGLGLGLAISRTLLEAQDGTIDAQSEGSGRGATFIITLPCVDEPTGHDAVTADPSPIDAPVAHERCFRVLLVEDHADTARVMARLLRASGHEVLTAYTVADAVAAIGEREFDILLSDIGLPDGTGIDLIRQAREQHGVTIPAVALTGFGMEDDILKTREAGFVDHLTKPVNFARLEESIQRACAGKNGIDCPKTPPQ